MMLRAVATNDIPELVDLINQAYRPKDKDVSWTNETGLVSGDRITAYQLDAMLRDKNTNLFAYTNEDDVLMGCVSVGLENDIAHIGLLTVNPAYQQLGIGKDMLSFAEVFSKTKLNVSLIEILVLSERQELIQYYLRRGYCLANKRFEYPINANFGMPLTKDIYVLLMTKDIKQATS